MLLSTLLVVGSLVLAPAAPSGDAVNATSLLRELNDPTAVARWPEPAFVTLQSSSFDRATKTPSDAEGWFANNDCGQFDRVIEKDGRKESVMLDVDGPGVVVRVWSPNPKGHLRIYLDGSDTPAIEGSMERLLDGSELFADRMTKGKPLVLGAALSRGWNLYLPVPFAKHCLITTDEGKGVYYQVNWRRYAPGTPVATQTKAEIMAAVAKDWPTLPSPAFPATDASFREAVEVAPNGAVAASAGDGPACVKHWSIEVGGKDKLAFLEKAQLVVTADGEETVRMPLLSFFSTDGVAPMHDARRAFDGTSFACSWPMPYQKELEVRIENPSAVAANVSVHLDKAPWTWDARSMRFHATWRRDPKIHTRPFRDYPFTKVTGQGVFVGDSLEVVNPVDGWWGEGDEKIYVDGETFPSHIGTGTEDYYGYGWCCPDPFLHPLHSQTVCDGQRYGTNYGRTIVTRLRGLDIIPFTKSFTFDMELWHWVVCDCSYAPTTFWYAKPGATWEPVTDRAESLRGRVAVPPPQAAFVIPGAIECEGVQVLAKSEGMPVTVQSMKGFGEGWSGDRQLWCQGRRSGEFVELAIPVEDAKPHTVTLYATKSWDYGILGFRVNGKEIPLRLDCCEPGGKVVATGPIDLGVHAGKDGRIVLRVEVVGGSEQSKGSKSFFGLDAVVLGSAP